MRIAHLCLFATALPLLAAGCASEPSNDASVVESTIYEGVASIEGDPIVCKTLQVLNTRIKKRVCDYKSSWDRREDEAQEWLREQHPHVPIELRTPVPTSSVP